MITKFISFKQGRCPNSEPLDKKLEFLDPQHQLGHCGLWCLQHVGSCPIVCRGERGRETDCDDEDDDVSADGDREEDEDEDEDHIDDNDRDDHCFICRKKGRRWRPRVG